MCLQNLKFVALPIREIIAIGVFGGGCEPQSWGRGGPLASTPPGMPGTHPLQYFGWGGRQWKYLRQYYYVRSDIADQY